MTVAPLVQGRLVLDTGGLLAWASGDPRARAYIREAASRPMPIVIPAVIIAQVIRGGPRDAPLNRLLNGIRIDDVAIPPADIVPVGETLARLAGRLLGLTSTTDVVDAIVAAEAGRSLPATILTGDLADMQRLVGVMPNSDRLRLVRI